VDPSPWLLGTLLLERRCLHGNLVVYLHCTSMILVRTAPVCQHMWCVLCLVCLQFYAMVDFCNPGCLGTPAEFRKHFESPILAGEHGVQCRCGKHGLTLAHPQHWIGSRGHTMSRTPASQLRLWAVAIPFRACCYFLHFCAVHQPVACPLVSLPCSLQRLQRSCL
jgi:hypothetical protein